MSGWPCRLKLSRGCPINRSQFLLYFFVLTLLFTAVFLPELSFVTPLALAILLVGSLILWHAHNRPIWYLGFPPGINWLIVLMTATGAGIALVLLFTLLFLVAGFTSLTMRLEPSTFHPALLWQTFAFTALIAASEEIIFRGVYLVSLKERLPLLAAAGLSALLWALTHLPGLIADNVPVIGLMLGLVSFAAFGILLALLASSSGGLWLAIGMHYGYNLGSSLLGAVFLQEESVSPILIGFPGWIPETGLIGVVVFLTVAAAYWQVIKSQ